MCVSAEVSFGASALLAAGGVWAHRLAIKPEERLIATFPFLFAAQQFSEGLVWVDPVPFESPLSAMVWGASDVRSGCIVGSLLARVRVGVVPIRRCAERDHRGSLAIG